MLCPELHPDSPEGVFASPPDRVAALVDWGTSGEGDLAEFSGGTKAVIRVKGSVRLKAHEGAARGAFGIPRGQRIHDGQQATVGLRLQCGNLIMPGPRQQRQTSAPVPNAGSRRPREPKRASAAAPGVPYEISDGCRGVA